MEGEGVAVLDCDFQCDIKSLLATPQRDFLIRNNGEQIIPILCGSFSPPQHQQYFLNLVETYNEFSPRGEFEVVFDYGTFHEELLYMPWLAVPNTEHETRTRIWEELKMAGIVNIVIVDGSGKVLCKNAFEAVKEYGIEAYPFTLQRIKEIEEQEVAAQKDQSLMSLFVSRSLDFIITNDDQKVPVSELDGKMVGLYIRSVERPLFEFTPSLVEVYKILKERGENFEIVFACLENENGSDSLYKQDFESMPCDGKILNQNAAEVVEEHGVEAYPFTLERLAELEEVGNAKQESQTLKSLLVSGNHDFLLGDGDFKVPVSDLSSKKMVPVSDLVGKTILLVFLERCSENADSIMQELTELFDEIKEKDDAFEMISVPYNIDGHYDLNYYPPWYIRLTFPGLIVPFGDDRIKSLSRKFKFYGNTMFAVLGPTGRTLIKEDAWDILTTHGAEAFPFTDDHLRDIEAGFVQMAKGWPEEELHIEYCGAVTRTYVIVLTRTGSYKCSMRRLCKVWPNEYARGWRYFCKECNFYLHPECALKDYLKNSVKEDEVDTTEQSMRSALFSCSCDFLISYNRNKKKKGVNFEIVLVPLDVIYHDYKKYFGSTQWFSVPYKGKCREKLACYFHIPPETVLMIFGPDGKIVSSNAVSIIEKYGYNAFPFTSERYAELAGMVRARVEEQTIESVLISGEKDFVFNNDGAKFPVIDLVDSNATGNFETEMVVDFLIEAYKEIKAKDDAFEVIHILDEESRGPWLGLPRGDRRIHHAQLAFQIQKHVDYPAMIALGPNGHLITGKAKDLILLYGADAYPFTDEHIIEVEAQTEEMAMDWPRKLKHGLHGNYDLVLQNIML
ncbi:hypothetical protein SO802_011792 [Lithocarpus litseifolius]|uniref:protein-disulfide reductase n=1 Tax=Lithocarpus litseifolius TaxID=425828 RepID=A0AAW2D4V3_9ROSI